MYCDYNSNYHDLSKCYRLLVNDNFIDDSKIPTYCEHNRKDVCGRNARYFKRKLKIWERIKKLLGGGK